MLKPQALAPAGVLGARPPGAPVPQLTRRETEMLARAAAGHSNRRIADDVFVSEDTVKTHLRRVNAKLGATNRAHAVAIAFRRGILR
ncbi:response regulator transcription factor [Mangrovihabitans endophyticus]|uniref:HTH luxR-type domain-containing protein n=1 Tax=Mangrovihabitans endophyticus TaxID=1751298 RepID=A0A8J3FP34_9ACTN|nr:helix-turn-helix transcriptional regulator [Mangrovihabitans endophyticus]GGK89409.1 hypothetical protein GCM10012284_24230 [Mangrovihabitans endophyticus]